LASLRGAAQKVDSLANFPFRPAHPAAACTVFPVRLASDASADPDVVRPSVGRFPARFPAQVRDFPSAMAAQVQLAARPVKPVPQPQVGLQKVVFQVP